MVHFCNTLAIFLLHWRWSDFVILIDQKPLAKRDYCTWLYCKLVMTVVFWFCAITVVYCNSLRWRPFCLSLLLQFYICSALLSLPHLNKVGHFNVIDGGRKKVCWVYIYNAYNIMPVNWTHMHQILSCVLKVRP